MHEFSFFWILVQQLFVGVEYSFLEVCEPFVERAVHEAVSVQNHAVEDEVFGLFGAIWKLVYYELPVDEGIGVEAFDVARNRKMQPSLWYKPVIITSVDQVVYFSSLVVLCEV